MGKASCSDLFLSRMELAALTGTKQPKRMEAWLVARGWVHESAPRRGDHPRVDRAYYFARMSGAAVNDARREGPRFDLLKAA